MGASLSTAVPGLSTRWPATNTWPAMMTACAFWRLSARPRSVRSMSSLVLLLMHSLLCRSGDALSVQSAEMTQLRYTALWDKAVACIFQHQPPGAMPSWAMTAATRWPTQPVSTQSSSTSRRFVPVKAVRTVSGSRGRWC